MIDILEGEGLTEVKNRKCFDQNESLNVKQFHDVYECDLYGHSLL